MNREIMRYAIAGIATLIFGVVWLLVNLTEININIALLWPFTFLIPGLVVLARYVLSSTVKKDWRFLLIGSFFSMLGLLTFSNAVIDTYAGLDNVWVVTLFAYPTIAAISVWLAWAASGRKAQLFIAGIVLTGLSLLVTCYTILITAFDNLLGDENIELLGSVFWPLLTAGVGLIILIWPFVLKLLQSSDIDSETEMEETDA